MLATSFNASAPVNSPANPGFAMPRPDHGALSFATLLDKLSLAAAAHQQQPQHHFAQHQHHYPPAAPQPAPEADGAVWQDGGLMVGDHAPQEVAATDHLVALLQHTSLEPPPAEYGWSYVS